MIKMTNSSGISFDLPITFDWDSVNISKRAEVQELALGGGVISGRLSYLPRSFKLKGNLFVGTSVENNAFYDSLKLFLSYEPIEVSRGNNRYIKGYIKSYDCTGLDLDAELQINISMIAPNPFFYGPEVIEEMSVISTETSTITVDGSIANYPIITVIIDSTIASGLSIEINDYIFELTGDLVVGDIVEINCKTFGVTLNGISVITSVGEGFLIGGIKLSPNDNSVIISLTGSAEVSILYRPLWI